MYFRHHNVDNSHTNLWLCTVCHLSTCVHIANSLVRLGIYDSVWPFPWVIALRCCKVPMDCSRQLLVHHAGFLRSYQHKHVFFLPSLEKWSPVICIHISIATATAAAAAAADTSAISMVLALHWQGRSSSGLINVIACFRSHAHYCTPSGCPHRSCLLSWLSCLQRLDRVLGPWLSSDLVFCVRLGVILRWIRKPRLCNRVAGRYCKEAFMNESESDGRLMSMWLWILGPWGKSVAVKMAALHKITSLIQYFI